MGNEAHDIGKLLSENEYPGRGIIAGKTPDGKMAVAAYFIMGRSENSRNRIFVPQDGGIRTQAFDPAKMTDPSLIIYSPVRTLGRQIIVSNGDQTDTVYEHLFDGKSFEQALQTRCFEPDEPNYTPRISALFNFDGRFSYNISILKSMDGINDSCSRYFYLYEPINGLGHFIHTYENNADPLPSFRGEPRTVSISDSIDDFTRLIWDNLNRENRVALFVQYTNLESGESLQRIINKNV